MEDTKSLLIMVLQKIFQDRPKVVEDTYKLIYNFNNGKRKKNEYEKTLKNICDLMNDELPSEILVYLLTLVDMPRDGNQLPIMEKIKKTYNLAENVRPTLLEYLTNKDDRDNRSEKNVAGKDINIDTSETEVPQTLESAELGKEYKNLQDCVADIHFLKPAIKQNKRKKIVQEPVKSLLDIAANYVIQNERKLKNMYKRKLIDAWKMINANNDSKDILKQCYYTLSYVNKKAKLLRSIEDNNIDDVITERYESSEILLKESKMFAAVNGDPFQLNEGLVDKLKSIINQ